MTVVLAWRGAKIADIAGRMDFLRKRFEASPVYVRVVPFFIFLALTLFQGSEDTTNRYWFYLVKTVIGAWLVWEMRPYVAEMKWAFSWEAVVVGILVCVMWVGINDWYPKFSKLELSNPHLKFGPGLAWMFIMVRSVGIDFCGATFGGGLLPVVLVSVSGENKVSGDAAESISRAFVCGDGRHFWTRAALSLVGRNSLRNGVSMAGDSKKPAG